MRRGDRAARLQLILSLAGVIVAIAVMVSIPQLRHGISLAFHGDLHGLRRQVRGLGAWGVLLLVSIILAHAVLFFPSEILNAVAGFVYGFAPGLALVCGAWLCSALLAYGLGRTVARPVLARVLGPERFARLVRAIQAGGITFLLLGRLLPVVPSAPMSYLAGSANVSILRFGWTTVVGSMPLTATVTYLGSRAQSLSLSDPFVWLAIIVLIVLLVSVRFARFDLSER
jgi:uncharacterized membrane protein YdjX (TVP38/TMEM64 family)